MVQHYHKNCFIEETISLLGLTESSAKTFTDENNNKPKIKNTSKE